MFFTHKSQTLMVSCVLSQNLEEYVTIDIDIFTCPYIYIYVLYIQKHFLYIHNTYIYICLNI